LLSLAPLVALALAPFGVFFRSFLLAFALFHLYGVWRFTTGDAPAAASRLRLWAWLLRALALAGVATITFSYEGYRALLIANVAVYLAYLLDLAPALGLPPRKGLGWAAVLASSCCVLVVAALAVRRWSNWSSAGSVAVNLLSALAVPLGALAWLEVDRARTPGVGDEPQWRWDSFRSVALALGGILVPFALGAGVAALSVVAGFWFDWAHADMEPGVLRGAMLFCLLCMDCAFLLVMSRWKRGTWRRAIVGAALMQVPVWWLGVFPTQFDSSKWQRSPVGSQQRSDMAEDLIYTRTLLGKTRAEVREMLGPPEPYLPVEPRDWMAYYSLGGRPCSGFLIAFDHSSVVRADFYFCD
jgi:hypothetical protein